MGDEKIGVIGSSMWRPIQTPVVLRPPSLTFGERVLRWLGRILCGLGHPVEMFGETLIERAVRRTNAAAQQEFERAFGKPNTGVFAYIDQNAPEPEVVEFDDD